MIARIPVTQTTAQSILPPGGERLIFVVVQNIGGVPVELVSSPTAAPGSGLLLPPGGEYSSRCRGNTQLWALLPTAGAPGTLAVARTGVERLKEAWVWKGPVDDMTIARLPFWEAQDQLRGAPDAATSVFASCEWHGGGPDGDPERTSFGIVNESGPLAGMVGERVLVTFQTRKVFVYVWRRASNIDAALSLNRRAFMALAPLSATAIDANIQVVV